MRRGFTFFEVTCVLLGITVVGMLAIPAALVRHRESSEARAVNDLRRLAIVEYADRRKAGSIRRGYASLDELLSRYGPRGTLRSPGLLLDLSPTRYSGASMARSQGYLFTVLLFGPEGHLQLPEAMSTDRSSSPAVSFLALAWPIRAGTTGYRAYAADPALRIWQADAASLRLSGPRPDFSWIERHISLSATFPRPFTLLLPKELAACTRRDLQALGLPAPAALVKCAGTR